MDELLRRSQLLAGLLKGTTFARTPHVPPEAAVMELAWDASSLLAKLLEAATPVNEPLDRAYAETLITAPVLSQLEGRGLVRWILNRMQIAGGARMAVARKKHGNESPSPSLEPALVDALSLLVDASNSREQDPVSLTRDLAESIRANHAVAHRDTPSLDALIQLGWFKADGTVLFVQRPEVFMARAAATLWMRTLVRTSTRGAAYDDCVTKAESTGLTRAASVLPMGPRVALLDEMLNRVLGESDLGDYVREWNMAVLAWDDLGNHAGDPPNPGDLSQPTEILEWWARAERHISEPRFGEMRDEVSALAGCIVQNDSLDGIPPERGRRILALLKAGNTQIFLLRAVRLGVLFGRPEVIAFLLLNVQYVRFALSLLAEIRLVDDASVGWTEAQQRRHELRVQTVWHEAMSIALEVLLKLPANEAASQLASILVPMSSDASADLVFADDRKAHSDAQTRLTVTLALLKEIDPVYPINGRKHRALPRIAKELAGSVHACLSGHAIGKLKILFWLLAIEGCAEAAEAIAHVLQEWLGSTDSGGWSHDHASIATYDWTRVIRAVDAATFDALLSTTIDFDNAQNKYGALNRERLFLRVLAKALEGLATRPPSSAEDSRRRNTLETRMLALLAGSASKQKFATDNPFSRLMEGTGVGANVEELTSAVARVVDLFSSQNRETAIRLWLGSTSDLILLTRAGFAMRSAAARSLVIDRITKADLATAFKQESTVAVAGMAEDAIGLGDQALAERILAAGDECFVGRTAPRWAEDSLSPRLALAALTGDQAKFDRLLAGATEGHEFQRGLLALHTDKPSEAVTLFEDLAKTHPQSPGAQVNVFAARIRAAQSLDAASKHEHLERAVREWEAARTQLQPEDRARVESTAVYNLLLALSELGEPSRFDDLLRSLPEPVRFGQDILRLAIDELKRRGETAKATELLKDAEAFHGAASWLDQLKAGLTDTSIPPTSDIQVAATEWPLSARELRERVNEALRRKPEEIAVIFGEPGDTVETLLRRLHEEVAEDMLLLEASLHRVRDEDKFNQIFAKILKGRIKHFGWTVHEGSPGGTSDGDGPSKGTSGGEGWRDWIIQAHGRELCVCEALRCQGQVDPGYVTRHVNKLAKYDPIGHTFALMIVYIELAKFDEAAEKYRTCVENGTYPDFPLATIEPNASGSGGLKAFKSVHTRDGENVAVHHVLIWVKRNSPKAASGATSAAGI